MNEASGPSGDSGAAQRSGCPAAPNPRETARSILYRLDRGAIDLQSELDAAFSKGLWDPRDRRLAAELTFGVARWRHRLDRVIRQVSGRRLKDLDRQVRTVLRLGVYQLLFLTRVPARAAVDSTVGLAGNARRRGVVNAVLRKVAAGEWTKTPDDPQAAFCFEHALPPWLSARWLTAYGPEAAALRAHQANRVPTLTLRVETDRVSRAAYADLLRQTGIESTPTLISPDGLRLAGGVRVPELPGYEDGLIYVQDEASQLVGALTGASPGERVLDLCAAPGGKTGQLARGVGDHGQVVAVEADPERAGRLRENLKRLGRSNVEVVVADATRLDSATLGALFDRVLVDAPCSGLGVLNRHPEGKWWKAESLIANSAGQQAALLAWAAGVVRPGGYLVYSVCTGEPEETSGQVAAFRAKHPEFEPCPADQVLGPAVARWTGGGGELDTNGSPVESDGGLDGFFAVQLVRQS
ncbi:MAG: 16S rRNA (cytosine(967)-C(5))-methyltransferase RsmB [Leptospirillia bacterium]